MSSGGSRISRRKGGDQLQTRLRFVKFVKTKESGPLRFGSATEVYLNYFFITVDMLLKGYPQAGKPFGP